MHSNSFPADAFGDPFEIDALPLPRPAVGYGVQRLDTDTLLNPLQKQLVPVREAGLACRFARFDDAHAAAAAWLNEHNTPADEHHLAIIPLGYDTFLERHVLIYGVLCGQP